MNRALQIVAIALLLVSTQQLQAKIYKWVDDNGEMHYSQTPPPDRKASEFNAHTALPDGAYQGPPQAVEKKQQEENYNKQRQKACEAAKSNLRNFLVNKKVIEDNKVIELTEAERQQRIKTAESQIARLCSDK